MDIHSTAIVSAEASIATNARVGPYAVIEDHAEIGEGCEIAPHAVIKQFTKIGARNRIFEHAVIGGEPQDLKFKGEHSCLVFSGESRRALKNAYQVLFRSGMPLADALLELEQIKDDDVSHLVSFIRGSQRGFTRAKGEDEIIQ